MICLVMIHELLWVMIIIICVLHLCLASDTQPAGSCLQTLLNGRQGDVRDLVSPPPPHPSHTRAHTYTHCPLPVCLPLIKPSSAQTCRRVTAAGSQKGTTGFSTQGHTVTAFTAQTSQQLNCYFWEPQELWSLQNWKLKVNLHSLCISLAIMCVQTMLLF